MKRYSHHHQAYFQAGLHVAFCIFLALAQSVTTATAQDEAAAKSDVVNTDSKPIDYITQIKTIIDAKCYQCHGDEEEQEGELNFDEPETLDEFIIKGNHAKSLFYEVLVSDDEDELMPPPYEVEEGVVEAMTEEEITLIATWIDQGASLVSLPSDEAGDSETAQTDDSGDDTPAENLGVRIWQFVGVLHPALTHFPVALFVVAAVFIIFCRRNLAIANEASFYLLTLGMLGAIVAAATGWSLGLEKPAENIYDFNAKMFLHRWSGIAVAALSFLVWIVAWRQRSEDYADGGGSWKLGVILLAAIVSFVGFQGGELSYGEGHYLKKMKKYLPEAHEPIQELIDKTFPEDDGEAAPDQEPADGGEATDSAESTDQKSGENDQAEGSPSGDDASGETTGDDTSEDSESDSDIDT